MENKSLYLQMTEGALEASLEKSATLALTVTALRKEVQSVRGELEAQKRDNAAQRLTIDAKSHSLCHADGQLKHTQARVKLFMDEAASLGSQLAAAQYRVGGLESAATTTKAEHAKEMDKLRIQLQTANSTADDLRKEVTDLKTNLHYANNLSETRRGCLNEALGDVAQLGKKLKEQESDKAELEKYVVSLRKEIAHLVWERGVFSRSLTEERDRCNATCKQLVSEKATVRTLNMRVQELTNKLNAYLAVGFAKTVPTTATPEAGKEQPFDAANAHKRITALESKVSTGVHYLQQCRSNHEDRLSKIEQFVSNTVRVNPLVNFGGAVTTGWPPPEKGYEISGDLDKRKYFTTRMDGYKECQ